MAYGFVIVTCSSGKLRDPTSNPKWITEGERVGDALLEEESRDRRKKGGVGEEKEGE